MRSRDCGMPVHLVLIMEMTPVQSTHIESVGYDSDKQLLHVKFDNGGTFAYEDVPPYKYQNMMIAPSIGSFLYKWIKNGGHRVSKVE